MVTPKGVAIYNTSLALLDDPDILSLKLVGGKVTFVHSDTLPLVLRVVLDPEWRKRKITQIDPEGQDDYSNMSTMPVYFASTYWPMIGKAGLKH